MDIFTTPLAPNLKKCRLVTLARNIITFTLLLLPNIYVVEVREIHYHVCEHFILNFVLIVELVSNYAVCM